jgi:hypothetical protein
MSVGTVSPVPPVPCPGVCTSPASEMDTSAGASRPARTMCWRSVKAPWPSSSQVEIQSAPSSAKALSATVASTSSRLRLAAMASLTLWSDRASLRRIFSAARRCFSRPCWTMRMTSSTLKGLRM